jgi:heterodisulfide reductase subunit A-like polyferredoxin
MSKNPPVKPIDQEARIGVYVCHCGLNIAQSVDCTKIAQDMADTDGVVVSKDIVYACSEPGQQEIKQDIIDNGLDRVVIASCSPRLHEPTFKKMAEAAGINAYMVDMANLREQCSWVHMNDRDNATAKAETLVNMAIARVRQLEPLYEDTLPLIQKTLVIGGGIAGIQAALDLADSGYDVTLVEKNASIGGVMAQIDKTFPTMDCSI